MSDGSNVVINAEPLKPIDLKYDEQIRYFEQIVNSFGTSYFNVVDVPVIEIYVRTYSEIKTLYEALALAGSVENKQYLKTSNMIESKIKLLLKIGASLRINPLQRKQAISTVGENANNGRNQLATERDKVTNQDIWADEK